MTKKYTILVLFVLFIISSSLNAQLNKISGTIEDLTTGEHLISAFIYDTLSMKGTTSNYYGFYSLPLKSGKVRIVYSYVGYKPYIIEFYLNKDTLINVKLDPQQMLEEVVVTSSGRNFGYSNKTSTCINGRSRYY